MFDEGEGAPGGGEGGEGGEGTSLTSGVEFKDQEGAPAGDPPKDPPKEDGGDPPKEGEEPPADPPKEGEEGKDGEGKEKDGEEQKGAPEEYEPFTLPEGVEADEAVTKEFQEVARELNLSQTDAQKLVDFHAQQQAKLQENLVGQWQKLRDDWKKEAADDPEIGGSHAEERLETSKAALRQFGTPGLVKLLEDFGIGEHPEVRRFFFRVGDALGEDTIHGKGGSGGNQPKSLADRMFPNHNAT